MLFSEWEVVAVGSVFLFLSCAADSSLIDCICTTLSANPIAKRITAIAMAIKLFGFARKFILTRFVGLQSGSIATL